MVFGYQVLDVLHLVFLFLAMYPWHIMQSKVTFVVPHLYMKLS